MRRYSIEYLETRFVLAAPDLSPLAIDGLTETAVNSGIYVATNPVIKYGTTPILSLQGSVSVNSSTISATGKVSTAITGQNFTLFDGGFSIPVGQVITDTLNDAAANLPNKITLGGVSLSFSKFSLAATGVKLDATAKLPQDLGAFTFTAKDVTIDTSGISAATLSIDTPQTFQFNLGGFKLNAQSLSAVYDVSSQKARLQGLFNAPQLNTTVDLTGQKFIAIGAGPTIDFNGGVSIAPVTIGGPWKLKSANLNVTYNGGTFATSGDAVVDTGGGDINIQASFANDAFSFTTQGQTQFQLLGMTFTISSFTFTNDQTGQGSWDPKLVAKGSLQLPQQFGGVTVSIDGANSIAVDSTGVSVTGGNVAFPGTQKFNLLNLLEVKATNANLAFDFSQSEVKLTGQFTVPTLNDLSIDLSGSNYAALKFANNTIDYSIVAAFSNLNLNIYQSWKLKNGTLNINQPYGGGGTVSGSFDLATPNNTTITVALAFSAGKLDEVTVTNNNPNPDFTFFGVSASVKKLKFIPDINPGNNDDFEPQLELQGSVALPTSFGTLTGGGQVKFEVADPEKFIVTETSLSLTGGSISIPAVNINLLGVVKVSAQSLNVKFISTPTQSLRVSGVVKIPQLFNMELNFDPAQNRFIEFNSAGTLKVNGVVSVTNVNIVPNVWVIKQASFAFDNTGPNTTLEVKAKIKIPGNAIVDGGIKFINGDLDKIELGADNLGVPLGATGVMLQRIGGKLENLANPTGNPPLRFTGDLGLSFGPRIDFQLPSIIGGASFTGSLVDLSVYGSIDRNSISVGGRLALVGDSRPDPPTGLVTGTANMILNWTTGVFSGDATINIFDGLMSGSVKVTATSQGMLTFQGTGSGAIPNSVKWIGGTTLATASGVGYYNGNVSQSFVAGWGDAPVLGTVGLRIYLDGKWETIGEGVNIPDLQVTTQTAQFNVNAGVSKYFIDANWTNGVNPANVLVEFVEPGGNRIDLSQPGNGVVTSTQLGGPIAQFKRRITLNGIQRTGTVVVTLVSQPGQQFLNTTWRGKAANQPPTITMNNATVAFGTDVTVNYTAADPDSQAVITFFVDKNNAGFTGQPVSVVYNNQFTMQVPELDKADSILWRSQKRFGGFYGIPNGTYFIYAMIDDNVNAPVKVYLNQPIVIAANPNPHVEELAVDSTKWTQRFRDGLVARNLGDEDGFNLIEPNGSITTRALPWSNIDRFTVTLSQMVDVPADAVTLLGTINPNYAVTFEDDTFNAKIIVTLGNNVAPAKRERLVLRLAETITDFFEGMALDGAKTGNPGNPALLKINALAGDVNGDGTVNAADQALFSQSLFSTADGASSAYTPFADCDGNGVVNVLDYAILTANLNASLPAAQPRQPLLVLRPRAGVFADGATILERDSSAPVATIAREVLS